MSATVEQRSIYSGPIRRSFDRLDSLTAQLAADVAKLQGVLVAAQADITELRARVAELETAGGFGPGEAR